MCHLKNLGLFFLKLFFFRFLWGFKALQDLHNYVKFPTFQHYLYWISLQKGSVDVIILKTQSESKENNSARGNPTDRGIIMVLDRTIQSIMNTITARHGTLTCSGDSPISPVVMTRYRVVLSSGRVHQVPEKCRIIIYLHGSSPGHVILTSCFLGHKVRGLIIRVGLTKGVRRFLITKDWC